MEAAIGLVVYLLGLCIGSFLNVVVYRLPRGLKISQPVWSFCPECRTTLRWYDNVPILSWLSLRARCRYCGKPISSQYPLIEAITGLVFVLTYYLLFVAQARAATATQFAAMPVMTIWPRDAALLLAWLILVTVLIACSAMDLILYIIDTRATDVALLAGVVGYALWPAPAAFAARAASPGAAAAVAAAIISGIMIWRMNRAQGIQQDELPVETDSDQHRPPPPTLADRLATLLAILLFVGLAVCILIATGLEASDHGLIPRQYLVPAALLTLFVAMVLTGGQTRPIDDELHAAIEAEAPGARRTALRECLWLTPAAIGAILAYWLVRSFPLCESFWTAIVQWQPGWGLTPLGGVAFSLHGAIVAAAAGWAIRIFFTFAFGREAFGTGDIYILAAAGAVGGWDIALLGFLLSVPIALIGWILSLVLKRSGMIPFGPPLAIGFLTALWLNRPAAVTAADYCDMLTRAWTGRRDIVLLGIGLLLIVLPLSIYLARLARRLVEPKSEKSTSEE